LAYGNDYRLVRVARIGKPHGIRGEVTVELFTDSPEIRFSEGNVLFVGGSRGPHFRYETLTISSARLNKNITLLKFEEFSDRNTAETLRNYELFVPAQDTSHESDSWYAHDLEGLSVHEESLDTSPVGEVIGLIARETQDLLEVRLVDGREVLLPLVDEIVPEILLDRRAILITPPPGLLELNQD